MHADDRAVGAELVVPRLEHRNVAAEHDAPDQTAGKSVRVRAVARVAGKPDGFERVAVPAAGAVIVAAGIGGKQDFTDAVAVQIADPEIVPVARGHVRAVERRAVHSDRILIDTAGIRRRHGDLLGGIVAVDVIAIDALAGNVQRVLGIFLAVHENQGAVHPALEDIFHVLAPGVAPGERKIRYHVGDPRLHAEALAVREMSGVPERAVNAAGIGVFKIRHGVELNVLNRAGGGERDARARAVRSVVVDIRRALGGVAYFAGKRAVRRALGRKVVRPDLIREPGIRQRELDKTRGVARELIGVRHKDKAFIVEVPVAVAAEAGELVLVALVQAVGGVFRAVADVLELLHGRGEKGVIVVRKIRERQFFAGAEIEGVAVAAGVAVRAAKIRRIVVGKAQQMPVGAADACLALKRVGCKAFCVPRGKILGVERFRVCEVVFLAGKAVFVARLDANGKVRVLLMQRFIDRGGRRGVPVQSDARLGAGIDEQARGIIIRIECLALAPDGHNRRAEVFHGRVRRGGCLRRRGCLRRGGRRGCRRLRRGLRPRAARRERKGKRRTEQQGYGFLSRTHSGIHSAKRVSAVS